MGQSSAIQQVTEESPSPVCFSFTEILNRFLGVSPGWICPRPCPLPSGQSQGPGQRVAPISFSRRIRGDFIHTLYPSPQGTCNNHTWALACSTATPPHLQAHKLKPYHDSALGETQLQRHCSRFPSPVPPRSIPSSWEGRQGCRNCIFPPASINSMIEK